MINILEDDYILVDYKKNYFIFIFLFAVLRINIDSLHKCVVNYIAYLRTQEKR